MVPSVGGATKCANLRLKFSKTQKNSAAELCQILRIVTIYSSICAPDNILPVLHAFEVMLLFLVKTLSSLFQRQLSATDTHRTGMASGQQGKRSRIAHLYKCNLVPISPTTPYEPNSLTESLGNWEFWVINLFIPSLSRPLMVMMTTSRTIMMRLSQWTSGSIPNCSARDPGIESRCGQLCLS